MKLGFFTVMMSNEPLERVLDLAAGYARIYARNAAINGTLDPKPYSDELNRSWNFRTIG